MTDKYLVEKLNRHWAIVAADSREMVAQTRLKRDAAFVAAQYNAAKRPHRELTQVWLIDDAFVMEPYLGGMLLGEVGSLDMERFVVVCKMTQEEFDCLMEKYAEENGDYPDM